MKSSSNKIRGFKTFNTKKIHNHFNESWNNKFYPINLQSWRSNQSNQNQIIIQEKKNLKGNSSFNKKTKTYFKNCLIDNDKIDFEDDEFKIIKNMWNDLGVTQNYQIQFVNVIKKYNEENLINIFEQEKKNLKRFRDCLLKLSKEISNRKNNILTLKKFDEILENNFPEQKINDSLIKEIIKIIQMIRVNSVKVVNYIIKIREISSYNKECG